MADNETNGTQDQNPTPEPLPSEAVAPEASGVPEPSAAGQEATTSESDGTESSQAAKAPGKSGAPRGGRGGQDRGEGHGRRGGGRRQQAEPPAEGEIEETVVKIYRCATVVKGGRRFSFAALVVVGDRKGQVGVGYGKANEVPSAVEKATKEARRSMIRVKMQGTTIPHHVLSKYRASKVKLIPAGEGTGVIAGSSVRAVMELAGVKDVLTKVYGSTSPKNLVKAAFQGLCSLRSREEIAKLREVSIA